MLSFECVVSFLQYALLRVFAVYKMCQVFCAPAGGTGIAVTHFFVVMLRCYRRSLGNPIGNSSCSKKAAVMFFFQYEGAWSVVARSL